MHHAQESVQLLREEQGKDIVGPLYLRNKRRDNNGEK